MKVRWFEEVRNKLIDLFYTHWNTTNGVNSFENCDIDASKFSIKVLGKGIKKEFFQFCLLL
jgi:hypothetical protein